MNIERKYLVLMGWMIVVAIIFLSLVPINNAMPDIKNGDKIGHFIAYFVMMSWFTWLYRKPWVRNLYAIAFIIMGGVLEILQSFTTYRSGDIEDFHVNTIGVIAGFVIATLVSNVAFIRKTFKILE